MFACIFAFSTLAFSKIAIKQINLNNKETNWSELKHDGAVTYEKLLVETQLPYKLEIQKPFKRISFIFDKENSEQGLFQCRLAGLETEWSPASNDKIITYNNLLPGEYTFIVKSVLNGETKEEASFSFNIISPFYGSKIFVFFIIFIIVASVLWFIRIRTNKLLAHKKNLEKIVKERTAEVVAQRNEINLQKIIVEEKHKEITDSINYARRIQSALLTSQEYWDNISPENFVIWKPKDVVSGDFHWAYQLTIGSKHLQNQEEVAIWCVADCTGHGVPGAFMSMLGISYLNEIVIENIVLHSSEILNKLRSKIIKALEHGSIGNIEQKDGMDMALCVWHKKNNTLEYTGANNSILITRKNEISGVYEIIELKSDRMPVGFNFNVKPFSSQVFQLKINDTIYCYTDGFADQFGGPEGKKYKVKQLKETLINIQTLPLKDQEILLKNEFNKWKGDSEQIDDVCIVAIKVVQ